MIIRSISIEFRVGTTTETHPVGLLIFLLLFSGFVWLSLIWVLKKQQNQSDSFSLKSPLILSIFVIGLGFRALFFGSTPIYEDDWNRYLWDGATITQGISPYTYSPTQVMEYPGDKNDVQDDLAKLSALSLANGDFIERINNPDLTTIYPPIAQIVFTISAWIKPLSLEPLRAMYLLSEGLVFFLLLKALQQFGRSPLWIWLYALNPILIFTVFNGAHMDILLVPFVLLAILCVAKRPILAGIALACAVGVKIWPLILGPLLYRSYNRPLWRYIVYGGVLAALSLLLLAPMLLEIKAGSGLKAYSETWQRSSFLYPLLQSGFELFFVDASRLTRLVYAAFIGISAMLIGLRRHETPYDDVFMMMCLVVVFFLFSPTGFPWYVVWFVFFLPFIPSYGVGLLCVTVSLYYARFWLGERGIYNIYLNGLVPIQFGLPLLIMMTELYRRRSDEFA